MFQLDRKYRDKGNSFYTMKIYKRYIKASEVTIYSLSLYYKTLTNKFHKPIKLVKNNKFILNFK